MFYTGTKYVDYKGFGQNVTALAEFKQVSVFKVFIVTVILNWVI